MVTIYFFPVLSRYENRLSNLLKLSFVMSIRYFYLTVLFFATAVGIGLLIVWNVIPIFWLLIIPGAACYFLSFLMEKPLLKYMPPVPEGTDDWYHEKVRKKKKAEAEDFDIYADPSKRENP